MNLAKHESERLRQILVKDKLKNPERFSEILKKETQHFLANYFEIEPDSLSVQVSFGNDGYYDLCIATKAKRIFICE